MAEYKQILDFLNVSFGVAIDSLLRMGLNIPLIQNEMAESFYGDGVANLMKDVGLVIEGSDVKSITESFVKKIKEVGLCQRANILEVNDSKIVLDLGECVLAPITKVLRGDDRSMIPPCPMFAILYGAIVKKTGKTGFMEKCEYKPEENTSIFTFNLEG